MYQQPNIRSKASSAWLAGWTYRKSHVVGASAGAGTNYAVKIRAYYDPFSHLSKYIGNPLNIPRYNGRGPVHPDVIYFPDGKDGYKYWMVYTPHPPPTAELPSIVRSNDGITWTDSGISNPVLPAGSPGQWDSSHLADPDIVYVSDFHKWFMVYAGAQASRSGKFSARYCNSTIGLAYSNDGKTWTKAGILVDSTASYEHFSDTDEKATSQPSLMYENGVFYLWYVTAVDVDGASYLPNNRRRLLLATFAWDNTNKVVTGFTRDSGNPIFVPAQDADFQSGLGHAKVVKYGSTYYMYCVRERVTSPDKCELALFTSVDKKTWINRGRVLARGTRGAWDDTYVYRASPVVDQTGTIVLFSGALHLYYSGYRSNGAPHIGYATTATLSSNEVMLFGTDGPRARSDFADVRFTDDDGATLLNYWAETESDGNYADFWVQIQDDLSSANQTIYIYWGKSEATTTSDGANTFAFFDDFLGSSNDATKWISTGTGSLSVSNSELGLNHPMNVTTRGTYTGGYAARFKVKTGAVTAGAWVVGFVTTPGSSLAVDETTARRHGTHILRLRLRRHYGYTSGDGAHYAYHNSTTRVLTGDTEYHTCEVRRTGTADKFQIDTDSEVTGSHPTNLARHVRLHAYSADMIVDYVVVRKYVNPEPSHGAWGPEENVQPVRNVRVRLA
jgi:predicted GH43/DUF377 family glycosyl hydrolase